MEFFLDSADLTQLRKLVELSLIDGVTTNPLLLSKQNSEKNYRERIEEIIDIVGPDRTVFAQVLSPDAQSMIKEAKQLYSWGPRMVIKLPATLDGYSALSRLSKDGIRCAITLVYTVAQGFAAAKYGAKYVAPFVARSYQVGMDGAEVVRGIADACEMHNLDCSVLGASLRTPLDTMRCIEAGAKAVTVPYQPLVEMFHNPCSMDTLKEFLGGWESTGKGGVFG